jgi:hypothetical protein
MMKNTPILSVSGQARIYFRKCVLSGDDEKIGIAREAFTLALSKLSDEDAQDCLEVFTNDFTVDVEDL